MTLFNERHQAAAALGDIGDKRALEPLIAALSDEDRFVRVEAADALGKIGDSRALPVLQEVAYHNQDETWLGNKAEEAADEETFWSTKVKEAATEAIEKIKARHAKQG